MIFGEYSYEDDIRVQRQEAFEDGAAQQKEEDDKLIAEKDAEIAKITEEKDAEIKNQANRIAELEALLAKK